GHTPSATASWRSASTIRRLRAWSGGSRRASASFRSARRAKSGRMARWRARGANATGGTRFRRPLLHAGPPLRPHSAGANTVRKAPSAAGREMARWRSCATRTRGARGRVVDGVVALVRQVDVVHRQAGRAVRAEGGGEALGDVDVGLAARGEVERRPGVGVGAQEGHGLGGQPPAVPPQAGVYGDV